MQKFKLMTLHSAMVARTRSDGCLGIMYNRENIDPSVQLWHPRNVRCAQHQEHNLNVREMTPCRHENVGTSKKQKQNVRGNILDFYHFN